MTGLDLPDEFQGYSRTDSRTPRWHHRFLEKMNPSSAMLPRTDGKNSRSQGTTNRLFAHLRFRHSLKLVATATLAVFAGIEAASAQFAEPIYVSQGDNWSASTRADFYTRDQGSQYIKYAWLKALKHPDGQPLLADQFGRYGYLPNPGNPDGLPVGFVKAGDYMGMTCSACHTRQISYGGKEYRIDGGPAIVDVQSLFADIDKAVAAVLASDAAFQAFAKEVLGQANPSPDDVSLLKSDVQAWFLRYNTLMTRALPNSSWGPGRLDAVGMIFNRLTGLDLGPAPSHIIADNIKPADAPVRYPFLWNAPIQDLTQWPGFSPNGDDLLALARNLGEVYGVFATFEPKKEFLNLLGIDYLHRNSANFDGLGRLENLIKQIGPPKYPWPIDEALAAKGKAIYERSGSCADCHGIQPGTTRLLIFKTWKTPLKDVGTDSREYNILAWKAKTGVLEGKDLFVPPKLQAVDSSIEILKLAIGGTIIQHALPHLNAKIEALENNDFVIDLKAFEKDLPILDKAREDVKLPSSLQELNGIFEMHTRKPGTPETAPPTDNANAFVYESRVMEGIWAAAPYLHNGSVPTLADLLEPADKRPKSFKIGPNYDIDKVGIAVEQTKFGDQTLVVSPDRNSGNSNAGHEFGSDLSADDKKALLEYLKKL